MKTLIILLLACEMLLYLFSYPPYWQLDHLSSFNQYLFPDEQLGWNLRDQKIQLHDPGESRTIGLTVHEGVRLTPIKNNERRFIFFGDSYVMGYGLDDKETFPWLLQEKLQNVDVINRGVSGYGTCQVYSYIRKLSDTGELRQNDTIFYVINDFHETRNILPEISVKLSPKRRLELEKFKFCNSKINEQGRLEVVFEEIKPASALETYSRLYNLCNDVFQLIKSIYFKGYARRVTQELISLIDKNVTDHGANFVVVFFENDLESKNAYEFYLKENEIKWIDCSHISQTYGGMRQRDGHPNKGMNEKFTECLKDHMQKWM